MASTRRRKLTSFGRIAWLEVSTARILHQARVDFLDQSQRKRECPQPLQAIVHRRDVVDDLMDIFWPFLARLIHFELQDYVSTRRRMLSESTFPFTKSERGTPM